MYNVGYIWWPGYIDREYQLAGYGAEAPNSGNCLAVVFGTCWRNVNKTSAINN